MSSHNRLRGNDGKFSAVTRILLVHSAHASSADESRCFCRRGVDDQRSARSSTSTTICATTSSGQPRGDATRNDTVRHGLGFDYQKHETPETLRRSNTDRLPRRGPPAWRLRGQGAHRIESIRVCGSSNRLDSILPGRFEGPRCKRQWPPESHKRTRLRRRMIDAYADTST